MTESPRYLLDVNVLIALLDEDHTHHQIVMDWFAVPDRQWAICPLSEAGFLRHATRPGTGKVTVSDATAALESLAGHPGYHYHPIAHNWSTLTKPFFHRLYGHKQVTDAWLLGMAIQDGLVLATFDRAILHMAGEHQAHVLLLGEGS